ncbi:transporter substrate-binding domain-containing protein [Lutibacter sp.]|uniref:ATP-binding protein n=1 Tax=Lutibacter sp. TaxID=1925666 RepID=UPI001A1CD858|nr:transporter substrate-binding domain-containing protein [Lutibacter sp.]MBI9041169.1 transporter substrate-binding domain-containing protein [Lutibacter sp.]
MNFRFLICFLFLIITVGKVNAQYTVMYSDNYPPYNFLNEKGELIGFNIDILNAIKKLYKTDIHIQGDEWNKINELLENGKIQAIGGAHLPGVLEDEYTYSRSSINTSHCFLYNTNHFSKFSLETLRTTQTPVVVLWKNDVLVKYIQSINPTTQFVYVKDYIDLIKAIDRTDVTCIFGQRIGSMYYAEKLGKEYVRPLNHRILERNMGFKVSKNAPELATMLNNGLEVILANGEYQRIYDKWIAKYDKDYNDDQINFKYILILGAAIIFIISLLLVINRVLQTRVREKTKDLRNQLELNSEIMLELENQKNKAEESDKMKSAFLANMSHEIRTPMNGILGFADLLKTNDYSTEKQHQFLGIIQKSGNRMLETINNIIDVSKLESGLEKPHFKEVDIQKIVNDLFNFFESEATSKGLKFILTEGNVKLTQPFFTDEYKLNSILTNLIKNALKFTKEGFVEISYSINNEFAEFKVADSGIGIPYDKQQFIFDQFVQADYSHSSGFEGSGLGLSISKGYVELLNGTIKLNSEPNKGTAIYIEIPNTSTKNNVIERSSELIKTSVPHLKKYNFIIAEDDETSYYFLEQVLKDFALRIIRAKDGKEAINKIKEYPDTTIIFMDIKMPILNGFEATEEIRKFNKNVYIIAQSAYIQENMKLQAKEVGCNSFIAKPIEKQKLYELLASLKFD